MRLLHRRVKTINFIELFAGIGGFRKGLESCTTLYNCVYANEFNKYAVSIYERHYDKVDNRDIREVKADEIPEHDLLTAGFPCQAFSIAGKRGGFEDTRGTLFFEIARILQQKQPSYCLLENVRGLLSHENGRTFQTMLSTLDEVGYNVQWQVLNSKHFGVPQNRERVFIVGHLRGEPRPEIFPIGGAGGKDLELFGYLNSETWKKRHDSIRRVYKDTGASPTIPTGTGGGVMTKVAITRGRSTQPWTPGDVAPTVRQGDKADVRVIGVKGDLDKRKTYLKDEMGTLSANPTSDNTPRIVKNMKIRRLTPTECERLQGFPDDWTKYGVNGEEISDTQRYKALGNAVTTNVIQVIGERLNEHIQP